MIEKGNARKLRDKKLDHSDWPDYVTVSHAVCAVDETGCGWSGFLLEAAFKKDGAVHNSGTGDLVVPAITNQICPNCGSTVYRTWNRDFSRI
jgi:predicted RNA-binding Zn-ribbon protein involved in translation (DUF1610 family)